MHIKNCYTLLKLKCEDNTTERQKIPVRQQLHKFNVTFDNGATSNTNNNLRESDYINDTYFAIGDNGTIISSNNGTNWSLIDTENSSDLLDITFAIVCSNDSEICDFHFRNTVNNKLLSFHKIITLLLMSSAGKCQYA